VAHDTRLVIGCLHNHVVCCNEYARERCGRHDYHYGGFRFEYEYNHADWDFDN
jgi:hypothetical protein